VAGCRLAGAERIVCVDLSEDRLEMARAQGATDAFIGGEDSVQRILDMTGGFGADYTFEATGSVRVMRQAVEAARMGWGLCTIAGVAGRGEVLEVVPRYLITGRRIAGASFGGAKGRDRVPELARLYLEGELDLDAFVSHRMPLDEVNHAFELMERQDGVRSVLSFD
jgi:S-(hydroxymethyl)glutathione dehydrogenase/alcohol dehydrogenase